MAEGVEEYLRIISELRAINAELRAEVRRLEARVAELEEELGSNSQNSSKPPSSEPIGERPKKAKRSKRKPGGQHGHKRAQRELLPTEKVDRVVQLRPDRCTDCGTSLENRADPDPTRHQVCEIPEIRPHVTEYQIHSIICSCGCVNRGHLPPDVSTSAFGPRLTSLIALMTVALRMSKRVTQEFLADVFAVEISLGALVAAEQRVGEALEQPYEEVKRLVSEADVANVDETGWREGGQRATLWTATTALATLFLIYPKRSAEALDHLMGEFGGILGCDRFSVYDCWPDRWKQYCWAHLKRNFTKISERKGESARIGKRLVIEVDRLFKWWHKARDGTIGLTRFEKEIRRVRKRFRKLLERGSVCGFPKTERTCSNLLAHFEALWTFARVPGVEPTNNAAERALRPAVLWRKTSNGTWSASGSRLVERVMSVRSTLRQQRKNVLAFLTETYIAKLTGAAIPSLAPSTP